MGSIEDKAIDFVIRQYEPSRGKTAYDVRKKKIGYDVESEDRKIEVKATKARIPNKGGLHITLLPKQYRVLKENSNYWIYRVYDVENEPKVIGIPKKTILTHLKPYTVRKLYLLRKDWEQLES